MIDMLMLYYPSVVNISTVAGIQSKIFNIYYFDYFTIFEWALKIHNIIWIDNLCKGILSSADDFNANLVFSSGQAEIDDIKILTRIL